MGCDPDKSYGVKCSLPSITKGGLAMGLPNGIHHLAICTKDIKKQIEFFTQVCGMELVALYWMHGRSEEHTSELQSRLHLVCRLLLEKKKRTLKQKHSSSL